MRRAASLNSNGMDGVGLSKGHVKNLASVTMVNVSNPGSHPNLVKKCSPLRGR